MRIVLYICLLATVAMAENTIKVDRETSVRKAIDTFGKIDEKEISTVSQFRNMFIDGKLSGQIRSVYAGYKQKKTGEFDTYATAIGGMLKYELASLNGFNAGFALTTSQDIGFATGDNSKHNNELSSDSGNYSELSEAYINYKNGGLNIRLGRQMIDTPLADTDDVRMIPNTFEAYMLTYNLNNIIFTLGNVQRWQGAGTGLGYQSGVKQKNNWVDIDGDGTFLVGVSYDETLKFNAWYYDVGKLENASKIEYFDIGIHEFKGDISLHGSLQYLHETQKKNSGVDAEIYGALVELFVGNLSMNVAYNKARRHHGRKSFSGIGGGSLYTSMDTMILDEIVDDRDASALVFGMEYEMDDWKLMYAYGDFDGKADSAGIKAHIVEQNLGFEYSVNDEFVIAGIYVKEEDKLNSVKTTNDWDRTQIMVKYDF